MTDDEETKLGAYGRTLNVMWKRNPSELTRKRYTGLMHMTPLQRINWIAFVEANAEKIEWCGELVLTAVELKLGVA